MFREPNVSELRCKPSHQGVAWAFTFWRNITIVFVSTGDAGWVLIYIRTSNKALKAPGAFVCLCCSQKSGSLSFNAISEVMVHSVDLSHQFFWFGAPERNRTSKPFQAADFKSAAYTIPPQGRGTHDVGYIY